jgi:hypothetical protein
MKGKNHMLHHPTHSRLKDMRLDGMAEAFNELEQQEKSQDLIVQPDVWKLS